MLRVKFPDVQSARGSWAMGRVTWRYGKGESACAARFTSQRHPGNLHIARTGGPGRQFYGGKVLPRVIDDHSILIHWCMLMLNIDRSSGWKLFVSPKGSNLGPMIFTVTPVAKLCVQSLKNKRVKGRQVSGHRWSKGFIIQTGWTG